MSSDFVGLNYFLCLKRTYDLITHLLMDSISNSGVSLILNPDIAIAINDNQHQHDLSTCEEEFENQEEIEQMLVNAFDSHSLSNTDNDEHIFDDEDEENGQLPMQKYFYFLHSIR